MIIRKRDAYTITRENGHTHATTTTTMAHMRASKHTIHNEKRIVLDTLATHITHENSTKIRL